MMLQHAKITLLTYVCKSRYTAIHWMIENRLITWIVVSIINCGKCCFCLSPLHYSTHHSYLHGKYTKSFWDKGSIVSQRVQIDRIILIWMFPVWHALHLCISFKTSSSSFLFLFFLNIYIPQKPSLMAIILCLTVLSQINCVCGKLL